MRLVKLVTQSKLFIVTLQLVTITLTLLGLNTANLALAGIPPAPSFLAVPLVLGHTGGVGLVLVTVKVLETRGDEGYVKPEGLKYLETVDTRQLVAISTFLRIVLLYGGFLQLFPTSVTSEVNHASSENTTDNENCMNSRLTSD